jgi:hypothetical protein
MAVNIYLDESGDLGFTFTAPHRNGGSSRYLTLTYLIIPAEKAHLPKRIIKDTFKKFGLSKAVELKGTKLPDDVKKFFLDQLLKLKAKEPAFYLGAITVKKEKVGKHITEDCNILYNYMMKLGILHNINTYDLVNIIRDERNIKVKSANTCVNYLQTVLWFDMNSETALKDFPHKSHLSDGLLFVDWISYMIWSNYEDGKDEHFKILAPIMDIRTLFF